MNVECYGEQIEVPDLLIEKYIKDFDGLSGKSMRESVMGLRSTVWDVIDYVSEDPQSLEDTTVMSDFINALAMKQALTKHGLYLDSQQYIIAVRVAELAPNEAQFFRL